MTQAAVITIVKFLVKVLKTQDGLENQKKVPCLKEVKMTLLIVKKLEQLEKVTRKIPQLMVIVQEILLLSFL